MRTPDEFDLWRDTIMKSDEEKHLEAVTEMLLEGAKEEKELAAALKKILQFVEEGSVHWQYNVVESSFSEEESGILERMGFLSAFGSDSWILCSEVSFNHPIRGESTRYTFRRRI